MKRTALILMLVTTGAATWAQANRDTYRVPYKAWRESAPELEREAGTPTPEFAMRAEAAAKASQDYFNARAGFITAPADQLRWAQAPIAVPSPVLDNRPEVQRLLGSSSDYLTKTIATFAGVKDPAIQQVRQAMERERAALKSLDDAITARKSALTAAVEASEDADALRAGVLQSLMIATVGRTRLADQFRKEGAQWSVYYRGLIDGAVSTARPAGPANPPVTTTSVSAPPAPAAPAKPTPRTAGQFPLARYVGEWVFPNRGLFYGAQPESIQLIVNEENGRMFGTMNARFTLSPGNTTDPVLKFTFEGMIQPGRSQSFPLMTESGAMGTLELIPGSAFNLLEVTFETGPSVGKVRSGNFVLLKR